jgi:chemotaxis response regulator CheB
VKKESGSKEEKQGPTEAKEREILLRQKKDGFPIVGIGASAGGLEALEKFLGTCGTRYFFNTLLRRQAAGLPPESCPAAP